VVPAIGLLQSGNFTSERTAGNNEYRFRHPGSMPLRECARHACILRL
jgi:hypothetical protein